MFRWIKRWMRTEHEFCQEELSAFLDGQLTRKERLRVQKHLERCAVCRRDLASLQRTVALLRAMPVVKPPRSFLISASEKAKQKQWQRTRLAYGYLRTATAMATVLLVLVVSSDALLRFATLTSARPMPVAVPEMSTFQAEPTPMKQVRALPTAPAVMQPTVETPTAMPLIVEGAVPEQSSEPTGLAMFAPLTTSAMVPQETIEAATGSQILEGKAMPSQTFARSAGAPAPPTASPEAVAIALPSVEQEQFPTASALESDILTDTLVPTAEVSEPADTLAQAEPTSTPMPLTATPEPTRTPIPPTAIPTLTPLPPTVMPLPMQTPVPTVGMTSLPALREGETVGEVEPALPRLWAVQYAARQVLPWLERTLGVLVALLLVITLWLRQAQRLP